MKLKERSFTVSEVSLLANTNLNTIQAWRRKGYFRLSEQPGVGWHRFTWGELFSIVTFAEVAASVTSYDFASSAASMAEQALTEILDYGAVPYLVGASAETIEFVYGHEGVCRELGKLISTPASYAAFSVADYSAIFLRMFLRLRKLDGVEEDELARREFLSRFEADIAAQKAISASEDQSEAEE